MLIGAEPTATELLWKNMYQEVLLHGRVGVGDAGAQYS